MQKYKPSVNRLLTNLAGISNTFFIIMGFGELLLNKSYYFNNVIAHSRLNTLSVGITFLLVAHFSAYIPLACTFIDWSFCKKKNHWLQIFYSSMSLIPCCSMMNCFSEGLFGRQKWFEAPYPSWCPGMTLDNFKTVVSLWLHSFTIK
jgi:hypothetical protein